MSLQGVDLEVDEALLRARGAELAGDEVGVLAEAALV